MDYTTVQIDNLIKLAMEYSDFAKLEGIKDVRVSSAMMALQMYITCDNGDVIQLIYEFGSLKIYATLVGLHCSNDVHIPVCRDEIARNQLISEISRDQLINELVDALSLPIISSNRLNPCVMFNYPFLHRGNVVYHLKCTSVDIEMIKDSLCRLVEDVLRKHKDGVLLDIANVRVDHLPKEIKEEWVLC